MQVAFWTPPLQVPGEQRAHELVAAVQKLAGRQLLQVPLTLLQVAQLAGVPGTEAQAMQLVCPPTELEVLLKQTEQFCLLLDQWNPG